MKLNFIAFTVFVFAAASFCVRTVTAARQDVPGLQQPASFRENKGQITDQYDRPRTDIQYKVQTPGMNLFIGSGELHYQWSRVLSVAERPSALPGARSAYVDTVSFYRMDVRLVGANKYAAVIAEDRQVDFEQYFLSDRDNGIRAYAYRKVTYREVYPGIDWVLYFNRKGSLEYDFIVHPGGNVADIRIQYDGATSLELHEDGSVLAVTPAGQVVEQPPYSFQHTDGKTVQSRFVLEGNVLSFHTESHKGTLVIDPVLNWATYYGAGGDGDVLGYTVTGDTAGNVYMGGYTDRTVLNIATSGSHQDTISGTGNSSFLVKFNGNGQRQWATYYGGRSSSYEYHSAACDREGNVFFTGTTNSAIGISTPNGYQAARGGGEDAFLVKFNTSGTRLWGTYFGGSGAEAVYSVNCAPDGSVCIAGVTNSTQLATQNAHQVFFSGGDQDAFLAKFNAAGGIEWATYYAGQITTFAQSVACDDFGNVFLGGSTLSPTDIATPGSHKDTLTANSSGNMTFDTYLVKFNSRGQRIWGTYLGTAGSETVAQDHGIVCGPEGDIYVTGSVWGLDANDTAGKRSGLATPGSHMDFYPGEQASFLTRFDSSGRQVWGTYYNSMSSYGITRDPGGSLYIAGVSENVADVTTPGAYQDTFGGGNIDAFIAKFDTAGRRVWGTYYGSSGTDRLWSIYADPYCHIYGAGYTSSEHRLATPGSFQDTFGAYTNNAILVKFFDPVQLHQPGAITGADSICHSSRQVYSVPPVAGAVSYSWTLPAGWVGSSDSNRIEVLAGSAGGVIGVVANGYCDSSQKQTFNVYMHPRRTFGITVKGDTLGTTIAFASRQWYRNDTLIPGATGAIHIVTQNAAYYVVITDDNGCADTSDTYTVNNVSVPQAYDKDASVRIFPNPAANFVQVVAEEPVDLILLSLEGKRLSVKENAAYMELDGLAEGIYLLQVKDRRGRLIHVEKLIKKHR